MRHSNPYSRSSKKTRSKGRMLLWGLMFCLLTLGALIYFHPKDNWQTADRSSSNMAPLPSEAREAIVQVYGARTFSWRKYFAVHTWVALKEKNAESYTVYQVLGYQLPTQGTTISITRDIPDRHWFGAHPELLQELRGTAAEKAIPIIQQAADQYPHGGIYRIMPGPNSNSFTAALIRNVPELRVELPPHAIGKDYPSDGSIFGTTETGTGIRINFWGLAGLNLGLEEGIEASLMGLNVGVDVLHPALKLPMLGRLGFADAPVAWNWWSITLLVLTGGVLLMAGIQFLRTKKKDTRRVPHFRHHRTKTSDRV